MRTLIGYHDKNSKPIQIGDKVKTFDKRGKCWIGTIVAVDQTKVIKGANPQYAFKSNYETWINNQEYASTLEIIE